MRRLTILVALALAGTVASTEAAKPASKPTAVKPTTAKTHPPKGSAVKPATVKSSAAKGSTVKATGAQAKGSTAKAVKPAKADAKATKVNAGAAKVETRTARVSTNTIDFAATGVGQKLQKNGALRSKLEAKLKAAGYTGSVYEAAYGFKNVGQFNAATNQVQNQGYSFELLKVLMTGTYVDPDTQAVYRANRLPDGTVTLVKSDSATNPVSTLSLGQSKQAIAAGAEMPEIVAAETTRRF